MLDWMVNSPGSQSCYPKKKHHDQGCRQRTPPKCPAQCRHSRVHGKCNKDYPQEPQEEGPKHRSALNDNKKNRRGEEQAVGIEMPGSFGWCSHLFFRLGYGIGW